MDGANKSNPRGPSADVSNEGTAWSAAWKLPKTGIVKGLASPLTRTPAVALLKLPNVWRRNLLSAAYAAGKVDPVSASPEAPAGL